MSSKTRKRDTGCLVTHALDTLGDRWTLLMIRDMLLYGRKTYSDFLDADEGIATNILADRLKYLASEGIVEKSRDPNNGRSNVYRLSDKGIALAPVILEMIRWSGKYVPLNEARQTLINRIEADRESVLAEIYTRINEERAQN